jgi:DnaJ-class molecular chaperone
MKKQVEKPIEHKCSACGGTGFPVVTKPTQPGRRIFPGPYKHCGGKGRTRENAGS